MEVDYDPINIIDAYQSLPQVEEGEAHIPQAVPKYPIDDSLPIPS